MPRRQTFRFLSNTPKSLIQGARQLPNEGNLLVITKSMKDCAALHELGIPAIAPCSEVLFVSKSQLQALKKRFKNIIVFYDNDLPGIDGMCRIKKLYPELQEEYCSDPEYMEIKLNQRLMSMGFLVENGHMYGAVDGDGNTVPTKVLMDDG